MKTYRILWLASFALTIAALLSCSKDNEPKPEPPTIEWHEVGSGNSKTGYPGDDLHLDAEIIAPGGIARITLEIHSDAPGGWSFEQVYTGDYVGKKNAEFHRHIDIPSDAPLGDYHLHLSVTDQAGQTVEAEAELQLVEAPAN